jgi:hypothetical protein
MSGSESRYLHVYNNVTALYISIRESQQYRGLPIKRAALRGNGEVPAEAVDFLCDVELKAKRVLSRPLFELYTQGTELPLSYKNKLGEVFAKYRLSISGDYKTLYFQTRKAMENTGDTEIQPPHIAPSLEEHDRKDR